MEIAYIIILGIVQGLTEFLPVSSSGHLVLLESLFDVQIDIIMLNIFLHLGSLLAVIIYYRKMLWQLIKHPFNQTTLLLFLATVPTVIIVLLFSDFIEASFGGQYLSFGFLVTALFMIIASFDYKGKKQMDKKTAVFMGVIQGLATLPGISRSGSTLTAGIVCGKDKKEVADFSFLMSIPVIIGSLVFECVKIESFSLPFIDIVIGMIFSFIFGYIAIKWMIQIVKKAKLYYFSIYLIILAIITMFIL